MNKVDPDLNIIRDREFICWAGSYERNPNDDPDYQQEVPDWIYEIDVDQNNVADIVELIIERGNAIRSDDPCDIPDHVLREIDRGVTGTELSFSVNTFIVKVFALF